MVPNLLGGRLRNLDFYSSKFTVIADLIDHYTRTWNMEVLQDLFPRDIVEKISNLYLSVENNMEDSLMWLKTPSGSFTTKSCYKLLADNSASSSLSSFPCKKLWEVKDISPGILLFIWKVVHNGVAVKENIARFNPSIDNRCTFCSQSTESIYHLLFGCWFTKNVFCDFPFNFPVISGSQDVKHIITTWLQVCDGGNTFILGSCLLWNIWKMRNDMVFSDVQFSKERCMKLAWDDYRKHCHQQSPSQHNLSQEI